MPDVPSLLKDVLKEIKPVNKLEEPDEFLSKLNKRIAQLKINAKAVFGGSFAKDTWLKGDHDVDIFVKFDLKYEDEKLSELLQKILVPWKPERIHGSRDYFHVKKDSFGFLFEIVPVKNIKKASDAKNVTDFSPWHVNWVNINGKKIKEDIRLTKKFCKANEVYGAESFVNGFSGHVVDILTIHYKGFLHLLKTASKWSDKTIIDPKNIHKGKTLFVLNKSKTQGPLVIVDPVQPDRNASAAVSKATYDMFRKAAKEFLKKPSIKFFEEKEIDFEKLKKKGHFIEIHTSSVDAKLDVAGTKLLKAFEYLKKHLKDFGLINVGWKWDKKSKALFWFVVKNKELPSSFEHQGPELDMKEHVEAFKRKYTNTYIKGNRIYAKAKRELRTPEEVLRKEIKSDYVKEKVNSISLN